MTGRWPFIGRDAELARAAALLRAGPERIILGVDDAHLLDDSSARVLLALASGPAATLVMTVGDPGPPPGSVQRLWRDGLCERVDVTAMPAGDVASLLEAVLGGPVDPRTARIFARRAQGNCLLLRELVGAALGRSALVQRGDVWSLAGEPPLSSGVREVVASRLAAISAGQRDAIEMIAAGEPLALGLAAGVVGESVLEEAETARLVSVRDGLGGPEVGMAHPLYGEVIRADMPRLRLRRLRLNLARALEAAPSPPPTIWSGRRCGGWRPGRQTTMNVSWKRHARHAASVSARPSALPAVPSRRAGHLTPPCCWPRS